jgi:hypothetical protein
LVGAVEGSRAHRARRGACDMRDWCIALMVTGGFAAGAPSLGVAAMVVGVLTPLVGVLTPLVGVLTPLVGVLTPLVVVVIRGCRELVR